MPVRRLFAIRRIGTESPFIRVGCFCFVFLGGYCNDEKGELVDQIAHHVETSGGYVQSAHEELGKAQEYQSKARKVFVCDLKQRMVMTVICLVVVL